MKFILILLRNIEIDMEIRRVLQSNRVMKDHREENNKNEEPEVVDSILVGAHKIFSEVHTFQIEECQSIHHRHVHLSEVAEFIAPYLPDDHCH